MSDEESEREALTDSSGSRLTSGSDSDSEDEEPPAGLPANGSTRPGEEPEYVLSSAPSPVPKSVVNGHKPVIPASTNWSDMVAADETDANNIPIVDFNDLAKLAADTNIATCDAPSTSTLTPAQLKAAKQKGKRKAKKRMSSPFLNITGYSPPSLHWKCSNNGKRFDLKIEDFSYAN